MGWGGVAHSPGDSTGERYCFNNILNGLTCSVPYPPTHTRKVASDLVEAVPVRMQRTSRRIEFHICRLGRRNRDGATITSSFKDLSSRHFISPDKFTPFATTPPTDTNLTSLHSCVLLVIRALAGTYSKIYTAYWAPFFSCSENNCKMSTDTGFDSFKIIH